MIIFLLTLLVYLVLSVLVMIVLCVCVCFLFFQAEDGIRDLVRSRGLGDVYKRQGDDDRVDVDVVAVNASGDRGDEIELGDRLVGHRWVEHDVGAVSYTHLTLPTSDLV